MLTDRRLLQHTRGLGFGSVPAYPYRDLLVH